MDEIESRISNGIRTVSSTTERGLIGLVRILVLPITLPLRVLKFSAPPALHIAIFLSLLPILGIFSISAGVLVSRWLPSGWVEPTFLQYGQGSTPYAYTVLRNLKSGQPYDINVKLVLPTSRSNYDIGNFMTSLTLQTLNNKTLATSQRPALLVPYSFPLRLFTPTQTTVIVPLFDAFIPKSSTIRAKLEVGRPDSWRALGDGEGKELAVVESYVRGSVRTTGLASILAISPLLTSITTGVAFFLTATSLALVLYLVFSPTFKIASADQQTIPDGTGPSFDNHLQAVKQEQRSSKNIKIESTSGPEPILRRRRSRLSERSNSPSSSRVPRT
ncbi:hypothetical protein FRB94_000515 [Tulasnella sp. JGI-2019a]|nr:hypothetical protein FRB93_010535 [Tulasnella sp. JGI-2019a]KAG9006680.1 hypothetical protein FRB94_000515 [Tulasnella sp. JGI-2019a]